KCQHFSSEAAMSYCGQAGQQRSLLPTMNVTTMVPGRLGALTGPWMFTSSKLEQIHQASLRRHAVFLGQITRSRRPVAAGSARRACSLKETANESYFGLPRTSRLS